MFLKYIQLTKLEYKNIPGFNDVKKFDLLKNESPLAQSSAGLLLQGVF